MKESTATIIAVGGVVSIMLGVLLYAGLTKQPLDSELVKQAIAGLMGFAGGAAVTTKAPTISRPALSDKSQELNL